MCQRGKTCHRELISKIEKKKLKVTQHDKTKCRFLPDSRGQKLTIKSCKMRDWKEDKKRNTSWS